MMSKKIAGTTGRPSLFFEDELADLKEKNLYREIRPLERIDGVRAVLKGREVLLFSSNDYLGLSTHPRVVRAAQEAAGRYGTGSGASRLISGTSKVHEDLEKNLALLKKKEAALLFTAGYLANLGILTALADKRDVIVMDKLSHASLIDGARLSGAEVRIFPHKNYERLDDILAHGRGFRRRVIVTDTVFSMDGDLADLEVLVRLRDHYDGILVVDDAHGTGVLGPTGAGAADGTGFEEKIDIVMGTLSKALGCLGGFAAASKTVVEYLTNFSRSFIFATSLPPAVCASASEAIRVLKEEPDLRMRLWKNVEAVKRGLGALGYPVKDVASPIFPVILGDEKRALAASAALLEKGILVPAIRPPAVPKGKARLRLTVSAAHTPADLEKLFAALKEG